MPSRAPPQSTPPAAGRRSGLVREVDRKMSDTAEVFLEFLRRNHNIGVAGIGRPVSSHKAGIPRALPSTIFTISFTLNIACMKDISTRSMLHRIVLAWAAICWPLLHC